MSATTKQGITRDGDDAGRPLLRLSNHHFDSCGEPPELVAPKCAMISYYENAHGEQWVFVGDRSAFKAEVHAGDLSWTKHLVVAGPDWQPRYADTGGGVVLSHGEQLWLAACLTSLNHWTGPQFAAYLAGKPVVPELWQTQPPTATRPPKGNE